MWCEENKLCFCFVLSWGQSAGSSGAGVCVRWDGAGRARSSVTPHVPPWRLLRASPRLEECWSGRRLRSWVVTGTRCTAGFLFLLLAKEKCGSGTFHGLLLPWETLLRGSLSPGHTGPREGHAWLLRWTLVLVLQVSFLAPAGGQKAVDGLQRRGHAGAWWGRGELWGGKMPAPSCWGSAWASHHCCPGCCFTQMFQPKVSPPRSSCCFSNLASVLWGYSGLHSPPSSARALKAACRFPERWRNINVTLCSYCRTGSCFTQQGASQGSWKGGRREEDNIRHQDFLLSVSSQEPPSINQYPPVPS